MIAENNCRRVALPEGALDLPRINTGTIQNWIDFGLWGLVFYDDQSPWIALVECLHVLHGRVPRNPLFEPPLISEDGMLRHEQIAYEVPLNFHLRHFLFRDREASSVGLHRLENGTNRDLQWNALIDHTRECWRDSDPNLELDVAYLKDRFEDVRSLQQALDVLRSTEVDAHTSKRWTSRHLLPLGPNMLFADVREATYKGDRRFTRRTGEMLYLMLGRSNPSLVEQLTDLVDRRLVSAESPWNGLAGQFRPPTRGRSDTLEFRTGYLPFARLGVYDRLAEDWIAILSLERREISESLDAIMRVSALHQVIYILHRAHRTRGYDGSCFPPFVFDLAASARKNPVQRVAAGQYDSHMKSARCAIEAYIDAFAGSPCWQEVERDGSLSGADRVLKDMWLWKRSAKTKSGFTESTPTGRLEEFRTDSISRTGHSIWSVIANHTRGAGLVEARRGAGTWYAPNDAMLEALVLANVKQPLEFGEFIRTLYRRYRIVVGQEQAQEAFPGGAMSLERFKDNEHRLEERLRVLRFIDRKSDACAFVVNPFYASASVAERGT